MCFELCNFIYDCIYGWLINYRTTGNSDQTNNISLLQMDINGYGNADTSTYRLIEEEAFTLK